MNVRAVHAETVRSVLRQQLSLGIPVRNRRTFARVQLDGKEARAGKMLTSVPAIRALTVDSAPNLWVVHDQIASAVPWASSLADQTVAPFPAFLNIIG